MKNGETFIVSYIRKKGKICIQIQNWEIWLARGFDFVLPLGVITPVMNTGEVDFDMLKSMEFGNLVDLLQSSRCFDRLYQGSFI